MKVLRIAVIVALVCVCVQTVCAVKPLTVQVSCQECSAQDGHKFYADAGKEITLTAFPTGGAGNIRFEWTEGGKIVCKYTSFTLTVTDNVEYILIVTDDKGSVRKIVKVTPNFVQESKCLPNFRGGIILRDLVRDRTEYSAGDSFTVKVRLDTRDCSNSNYQFYWRADDENIIFANPNSTETEVRIGQGISGGKVEIEAILTNGEVIRQPKGGGIEIEIVSNTPPSEIKIGHDRPVSYTDFKVYCVDFKTGESRNEYKDFIHSCSAILKNETSKKIIDSASKTVGKDKEIPYLKLKPKGIGIYFIEYTIKDSHGAFTTVNETIEVVKGDTGKDIPIVCVPDLIYCAVGKICVIDASETDKDVSNFGFYRVDDKGKVKERLANSEGDYYSGPICNHIFTYPGTYRIRIEASYFDEDDYRESEVGFKIVTVIVSSRDVSVTPASIATATRTVTPAPVSTPTAYVRINMVDEPETEKGGFKKILSGIIDLIDTIKNALKIDF